VRARSALTVAAIGTTQTLAWGSSYYLPAVLADPISAGLGVPKSIFFGLFSGSLLLQAALGPAIGKAIDRHGGRGILVPSNLILAAGLLWLASAQGTIGLAGAWAVLGVGMALGLYDAAFAALTALYGRHHLDRRLREYRRLAFIGAAQRLFRVARRLSRLGSAQPLRLLADQSAPRAAAQHAVVQHRPRAGSASSG